MLVYFLRTFGQQRDNSQEHLAIFFSFNIEVEYFLKDTTHWAADPQVSHAVSLLLDVFCVTHTDALLGVFLVTDFNVFVAPFFHIIS
jgi:hypothetical protein